MAPRVILYTGKGGVGKTSVAAATARRCAAARRSARSCSRPTRRTRSPTCSSCRSAASRPSSAASLWAQQVSAQDELEQHWSAVQGWLGAVLIERGVERIAAEELTVPPGGDELFSLLQLKRHVEEGGWDVIVVDCAPTGETLRLLSFPDAARWWLDKLLGRETQLLAAARPLARAFLDLRAARRARDGRGPAARGEPRRHARDPARPRQRVSLRLVMTPDRMVVAEAMRTFTYLNLYGYLTDAVVVNRVFPEELDGTYFGAWRELQQRELARVRGGLRARARAAARRTSSAEVVGPAMLDRARRRACSARATRPARAARRAHAGLRARGRPRRAAPDAAVRRASGDISLKKIGDELVVRVDGAEAHGRAAARARGAAARGRRRSTTARWWCALADTPSRSRSPRCASTSTRPTPPPTGWCARPQRGGRGVATRRRAAPRLGAAPSRARAPSLPDLQRARRAPRQRPRARVPPELSRQLPRRCAISCSRCAR